MLERASARETAVRVAAGALARLMLRAFGIETIGYVTEITVDWRWIRPPERSIRIEPFAMQAASIRWHQSGTTSLSN